MKHSRIFFSNALVSVTLALGGCSTNDDPPPPIEWVEGVYQSASRYAGICRADYEKYFLRSVFNRYYYWYEQIIDRDPAGFGSPARYFDELVIDTVEASSKDTDAYSTFIESSDYANLVSGDGETGYGMRLTTTEPEFGGDIFVGYVVAGSPAASAGIKRGDRIESADGYSLDGPDRDLALGALFPARPGETHDFRIAGSPSDVSLTSANVDFPPVQHARVLTGTNIGYVFFDDHALDAESELIAAFDLFAAHNGGAGIDDLVLDLRYNSGGLLFIASQLAYMIAGDAQTNGKFFEQLRFNNRFFTEDFDFLTTGVGASGPERALPSVSLNRVAIISDHATCSASESIINALLGIDVDVILIGEQTCGKPYGFFGHDNCGVTWLPVEFQSFNYKGDSGYEDGFRPDSGSFGVELPGCRVDDDFSQNIGDASEARVAAALQYLNNSSCPAAAAFSAASNAPTGIGSSNNALRSGSAAMHRAQRGWRIVQARPRSEHEDDDQAAEESDEPQVNAR